MLRTALSQARILLAEAPVYRTVQQQQTRNTVIVKRLHPMRLWKKGQRNRKIKSIRDQVYVVGESLASKPDGDMDVLLMKDISGVGQKGDVVTLPKRVARNRLLPLGIAVYPSQENIHKHAVTRELTGNEMKDATEKTIRQLEGMNLRVPMNPQVSWVLNETHVRLAFRKVGVVVPPHAIRLPKEPITEPQNFTLGVRINGQYDVKVNAITYHFRKESTELPGLAPVWSKSKQTLEEALKRLNLNL